MNRITNQTDVMDITVKKTKFKLDELYAMLHGDDFTDDEFMAWKKERARQFSYLCSLKNNKFITQEEREQLTERIAFANSTELRSYDLRGFRSGVLKISAVLRKIQYPKDGIDYVKRKYKPRNKPKATTDPELAEARKKFRMAVYYQYQRGTLDLAQKELLYQFMRESSIEDIEAHPLYPRTYEKKKKSPDNKTKDVSRESPELSAGSSSNNHRGRSDNRRTCSSSEGSESDPGECDIPVRRPAKNIRRERVQVHCTCQCGHYACASVSGLQSDSPQTPEHQPPEQSVRDSPRERNNGNDHSSPRVLQSSVNSQRAKEQNRRRVRIVKPARQCGRSIQHSDEELEYIE